MIKTLILSFLLVFLSVACGQNRHLVVHDTGGKTKDGSVGSPAETAPSLEQSALLPQTPPSGSPSEGPTQPPSSEAPPQHPSTEGSNGGSVEAPRSSSSYESSPKVETKTVSAQTSNVSTTITNNVAVVIDIAGYVRGTYDSPDQVSNAGVNATIVVDGVVCAKNLSFEALSSSITFYSSASCVQSLSPGTHRLEVYDSAAGSYPNMGSYYSHLQGFVVENLSQ